ncbi:MAG: hypothetical protein A2Y12_16370 [Planctomycetes bacterium GWF2_42_9]|nr:MAG: hypothetical protein A2Y12_16370 [Planctomycetes bacterium GWF2_42_9]
MKRKELDIIAKKLTAKFDTFCWLGVRATDALPFQRFFSKYSAVVLNNSLELSSLIDAGWQINTYEKLINRRKEWYSGELDLLVPLVNKTYISQHSMFVPFASTAQNYDLRNKFTQVLSISPELRMSLEKKPNVRLLENVGSFRKNKIIVGFPNDFTYSTIRNHLGGKFVAQQILSIAGNGTFLIENVEDWTTFQQSHLFEEITFSRFIDGPVGSVTAVVGDSWVVLGPITRQVVHVKELANHWATYSGNIFYSSSWHVNSIKVIESLRAICKQIQSRGYRGIINFNVLLEGPFLTDINPRFMGHFRFFEDYMKMSDQVSFAALHLLSFYPNSFNLKDYDIDCGNHNMSLMVMHLLDLQPRIVKPSANFGIYREIKGSIEPASNTFLMTNVNSDNFAILDPVPLPLSVVDAGSELCRIVMSSTAMEDGSNELSPRARRILGHVRNALI